jgi:hypothetical protein
MRNIRKNNLLFADILNKMDENEILILKGRLDGSLPKEKSTIVSIFLSSTCSGFGFKLFRFFLDFNEEGKLRELKKIINKKME